MTKKKICFITAVPITAEAFLRDHMAALQQYYQVYYATSEPSESSITVAHDGYKFIHIERRISLVKDIKALFQLIRFFRKEQFDSVHSVTPKAGLLTAIAGYIVGVPVRIHIFTGQVWANKKGLMRWLLKLSDRAIVHFANHFLVDGESQRQFLIQQNVLKTTNSKVLGHGSICGVNLNRFMPDEQTRIEARNEIGIQPNQLTFVFLGRLNRDKGLYELLSAFNRLAAERDDVFLCLIGRDEENISSHFPEYNYLTENSFLYYGPSPAPQNTLQAGDIFVLPTHREGFGSSVIEASALGLPVICSDAYGVIDAMVDNVTGLRCKVGDSESLYKSMKQFADNRDLVRVMGMAGRERVIRDFDGNNITQLWVAYYNELLHVRE